MRRRECAEGDHACTYQLTSAEANKAASKSHANLGCQVDAGGAESSLSAQMRSCHVTGGPGVKMPASASWSREASCSARKASLG
jgi:hypothetical protein